MKFDLVALPEPEIPACSNAAWVLEQQDPSWATALRIALDVFYDRDFQWGVVDCCQLCRAYVAARSGRDPGTDLAYESSLSAYKIVARYGGIHGLLTNTLKTPMKHPRDALPGDIVLVSLSDESVIVAAGIFNGQAVWTIDEAIGLCQVSFNRIVGAWACPLE